VTRHSQHLPPAEAMLLRLTADYARMPDSTRPDRHVLPSRAGVRCRHHTDVGASALCQPNFDCTPPCPPRSRCATEIPKTP
jgi:hypothetical protein